MTRLEKIQLAIKKGITCNPETGKVYGVRGKEIISRKAGKKGYLLICVYHQKKRYFIKSHQFIYYWVNKEVVDYIDHINRNPADNKIDNLRKVNQSENLSNTDANGFHITKSGKYLVRVMKDYKSIRIGLYSTLEEARLAYLKAKKEYFPNIH